MAETWTAVTDREFRTTDIDDELAADLARADKKLLAANSLRGLLPFAEAWHVCGARDEVERNGR